MRICFTDIKKKFVGINPAAGTVRPGGSDGLGVPPPSLPPPLHIPLNASKAFCFCTRGFCGPATRSRKMGFLPFCRGKAAPFPLCHRRGPGSLPPRCVPRGDTPRRCPFTAPCLPGPRVLASELGALCSRNSLSPAQGAGESLARACQALLQHK